MSSDPVSRRDMLKIAATTGLTPAAMAVLGNHANLGYAAVQRESSEILDIGTRRELFIDGELIQELKGKAFQRLQQPRPRELVLRHDAPWEGTGSGYHSLFQDGDLYRMYYKAWHLDAQPGKLNTSTHPLYCCYAESNDGIQWRKPPLGLHEFQGSTRNNIVLNSETRDGLNVDAGHPAVFRDENPSAPDSARYKAILRSSRPNGLLPFQSPDGIHWSPMSTAPILGGLGAFDSQNLAFWDPTLGKYRAYWRYFTEGRRDIRTATSDNLLDWDEHQDLRYVDSPPEHLYTNQVKPYHRAPHILIGFPARYVDRGWSESTRALPEREHRELRASSTTRYGTAITDSQLMASRDGVLFHRWNEAFLRPGPERPDTWNYGHQYIGWHLVETRAESLGAAPELSLYATESYWTGQGSALRRYTLRLDGFVALGAPSQGGAVITKPLTFSGATLHVNFASSAAGAVRVELQKPDGTPIPGFALADCDELFGDTTDRVVTWQGKRDVQSLVKQPIRIHFQLTDADLYSFQFSA